MKICYLAKFNNETSDNTEQHIKYAFEKLGHTVVTVNEDRYTTQEVLDKTRDADFFLFHKGGVHEKMSFHHLMELLTMVICPKVCWYFDKLWGEREGVVQTIIPFVDYCFMTDESWANAHDFKNIKILRQGIGNENTSLGKFTKELECDMAYVGQIYGSREQLVEKLSGLYGDKFKVFGNIFNRNLYDLCASAKIIVAPKFPSDDFYWSSRIYMILGSGGFLIHPKLEGLKEEFKSGKHFAGYTNEKEIPDIISYYLSHEKERKKIQEEGYKLCISKFTYLDRCKTMLEILNFGKKE